MTTDMTTEELLIKILQKVDVLQQDVSDALARLEKLEKERQIGQWAEVPRAAEILGLSPEQIRDRIRDGRWRHGKEFINASDGSVPRYRINLGAVEKLLATPPEKRRPAHRQ